VASPEETFWVQLKRRLNPAAFGHTAQEIASLNKRIPLLGNFVVPVSVIKPTDGTFPDPSSATPVDPFADIGGIQWPYALTAKTSPVIVNVGQKHDTTTDTYVTLESPSGTDYVVPASKVFHWMELFVSFGASVPADLSWGYGDNGVAPGTTAPTNAVFFPEQNWIQSTLGTNTCIRMPAGLLSGGAPVGDGGSHNFLGSVPAGKYPFIFKNAAGVTGYYGWGLEVST